jgi:hypothetical protein
VKAFDLTGRLVKVLANLSLPNGQTTVTWDATNMVGDPVASGLYLVVVEGPALNQRRFCAVLR